MGAALCWLASLWLVWRTAAGVSAVARRSPQALAAHAGAALLLAGGGFYSAAKIDADLYVTTDAFTSDAALRRGVELRVWTGGTSGEPDRVRLDAGGGPARLPDRLVEQLLERSPADGSSANPPLSGRIGESAHRATPVGPVALLGWTDRVRLTPSLDVAGDTELGAHAAVTCRIEAPTMSMSADVTAAPDHPVEALGVRVVDVPARFGQLAAAAADSAALAVLAAVSAPPAADPRTTTILFAGADAIVVPPRSSGGSGAHRVRGIEPGGTIVVGAGEELRRVTLLGAHAWAHSTLDAELTPPPSADAAHNRLGRSILVGAPRLTPPLLWLPFSPFGPADAVSARHGEATVHLAAAAPAARLPGAVRLVALDAAERAGGPLLTARVEIDSPVGRREATVALDEPLALDPASDADPLARAVSALLRGSWRLSIVGWDAEAVRRALPARFVVLRAGNDPGVPLVAAGGVLIVLAGPIAALGEIRRVSRRRARRRAINGARRSA